jgi:ADP-heptose:LPS heptosyltransferase
MIARGIIRILASVLDDPASRKPHPEDVRRILLVETTRFGDLMAALSTYRRFSRTFPNAAITLLIHPAHASVLRAIGIGCDVIAFPWPDDPFACITAMLDLHDRRFDYACSMSPSTKNSFLALYAAADIHAGYLDGNATMTPHREVLAIDSTCPAVGPELIPYDTNLYDRAMAVADQLGCVMEPYKTFQLPASFSAQWPSFASRAGLDPVNPIVVLHPFAGWEYRTWPPAQVDGFIEMLRDACPEAQVVVLGTPRDIAGAYPLGSAQRPEVCRMGTTDWSRTALVIAHAAVFIGTDSGPLHLAAALGTPFLGLYGPAPPDLTGPPVGVGKGLFADMECSPCDQRTCVVPGHPCMHRHKASAIFEAVAPYLLRTTSMVADG